MKERTVKFEITLPMTFNDNMDDDTIEFLLNESSWCMSNLIDLLEEYDREHGCLCNICEAHICKEADDE